MVEALDKDAPGIASEYTLFYGVEAKFYSARPKLNKQFETEIHGLYCGGDGAGITRGLAQVGAAGVWIARGASWPNNRCVRAKTKTYPQYHYRIL